jgi:hypothetical protein
VSKAESRGQLGDSTNYSTAANANNPSPCRCRQSLQPISFMNSVGTWSATRQQKRSAHRNDPGDGVRGLPPGFACSVQLAAGDESEDAEQGEHNTAASDYPFHRLVLLRVDRSSANFPHSASLTLSNVHRQRSGMFRQRRSDSGCTVNSLTCNVHREPGQGRYEETSIPITESPDISETRSHRSRCGRVCYIGSSLRQRLQSETVRPAAGVRLLRDHRR